MKPFKVSPAKRIVVRFSNEEVNLPSDTQSKIDAYWNELITSGKPYRRGEVFTVTHKEVEGDVIDILVAKTDYAHHLYCENSVGSLGEHAVRLIHPAALVETSDGYFVFGEMGSQTSRSGIIQLCGGGIDYDDLSDGIFDFQKCISRELQEELGINVLDPKRVVSFEEVYFKEGGLADKLVRIFKVRLTESKDEFLEKYDAFVRCLRAKEEEPEFGEIITLKKSKQESEVFFKREDLNFDEYMKPLFRKILEEIA
jgi:8-oxo-dGTP pyrophosphatase MutT (NUDIX family)